MLQRRTVACFVLSILIALYGCDPLSITLAGIGASAGVSHTLNGITYRTFTASLPKVRKATLTALGRMSIKVSSTNKIETGEVIRAATTDREIEIELEVVTARTTRMRTVAKKGSMVMDSATANEIIAQTGKVLGV